MSLNTPVQSSVAGPTPLRFGDHDRLSSVGAVLREATKALAHTNSPGVTAQALVGHVLGLSRAQVLARPERLLTADEAAAYEALVARAAAGEPLAYLTGKREFCGLVFEIDANVLVPRPETELLVELALKLSPAPRRIVDVGTGSGCIAVTLAARLPEAAVTAVDVSSAALAVARRNAERHGVAERMVIAQSDLLQEVSNVESGGLRPPDSTLEEYDLIIANLPYIDSDELRSLPVAAHEPRLALDGGPGGLALLERLLAQARERVAPGGSVLLEIGAGQGVRARVLARAAFPEARVTVHRDWAGLERVVQLNLPYMIELRNEHPKNKAHFTRLLEFCQEIVAICNDLDIAPVLNGSLAVFGYTKSRALSVNDIDLACSELEFPRLSRALAAKGIAHAVKDWHVLQARREDLKVEFDSMEYWLAGLPNDYVTLMIGGHAFKVVSLPGLRELYRRGVEATARRGDAAQADKYAAIALKYRLLGGDPDEWPFLV